MCFRDYVFALMLFCLMVFVLCSMNLTQTEQIRDLREEVHSLRQSITVTQDSILANVKTPVWWR
jgi:predicted amino acid-binding ACT domain protein